MKEKYSYMYFYKEKKNLFFFFYCSHFAGVTCVVVLYNMGSFYLNVKFPDYLAKITSLFLRPSFTYVPARHVNAGSLCSLSINLVTETNGIQKIFSIRHYLNREWNRER